MVILFRFRRRSTVCRTLRCSIGLAGHCSDGALLDAAVELRTNASMDVLIDTAMDLLILGQCSKGAAHQFSGSPLFYATVEPPNNAARDVLTNAAMELLIVAAAGSLTKAAMG